MVKKCEAAAWDLERLLLGQQFNSIGQMKQLTQGSLNVQYNYPSSNNNGKIASETDVVSGETVTYTYDKLNRLASATSSTPNWGQSFGYDGFGNLNNVSVTKGSAPTLSVTYNASTNRRTNDCADASGNISPCGNPYTFDAANRITSVMIGGGYMRYSYDTANRRVWRGDGTTDELTYYSASGSKLTVYNLSVSGSNLRATSAGTFEYFAGKMLKNPSGWINSDRLSSVGKFFPYGQERPSATGNNKEKFATYYRDTETSLDYAENRYYQPGDGRFLSPDPYRASAGLSDPGSWNRYAYVQGDPVSRIDPSGLDYCSIGPGPELCVSDGTRDSMCTNVIPGVEQFWFCDPNRTEYVIRGGTTEDTRIPLPGTDPHISGPTPVTGTESGGGVDAPQGCPEGYTQTVNGCVNLEAEHDKMVDQLLGIASDCAIQSIKNHYGLTGTAAILSAPIPKAWVPPYKVVGNPYTSVLSVLGRYINIEVPRIARTTNGLRALGRLGLGSVLAIIDTAIIWADSVKCFTDKAPTPTLGGP